MMEMRLFRKLFSQINREQKIPSATQQKPNTDGIIIIIAYIY